MTATIRAALWSTDGRRGVHRWAVRLVGPAVILSAASAAGAWAQPAPQGAPTVSVREAGGVYVVSASFRVAASPAAVLRVLTDYEAIPRIVPDVLTSVVRARHDATAIVEQEAVSRVLFFSKTVHLRLQVVESADGIVFHDVCRRSFAVYEGAWRVTGGASESMVTYQLRAQPTFDVPSFLVKRLLKRDAGQMLAKLGQAMVS